MAIVLTPDQRNALRDQIFDRLPGVSDVWLHAQSGKFDMARRLGGEFADDLRMLNDCLGWEEEEDSKEFPATLPTDLLKRVFTRHRQIARQRDAGEDSERVELRENKEANEFLIETCTRALVEIDAPERIEG